jgi:hypothetical protein
MILRRLLKEPFFDQIFHRKSGMLRWWWTSGSHAQRRLPGFPLVGGRKPDSEINHEVLGADICNGLKLRKSRISGVFFRKRAFPIDEEQDTDTRPDPQSVC